MESRQARIAAIGTAALVVVGGIAWSLWPHASSTSLRTSGIAPESDRVVDGEARAVVEALAPVPRESTQLVPEPAEVAQLDQGGAPQSLEEKYANRVREELVAARLVIVAERSKITSKVLKEKIKRGDCEVRVQPIGTETDMTEPRGWSSIISATGNLDGTETVRIARLELANHPATKDIEAEFLWLNARIEELGASK